jgi:hypothetical protein
MMREGVEGRRDEGGEKGRRRPEGCAGVGGEERQGSRVWGCCIYIDDERKFGPSDRRSTVASYMGRVASNMGRLVPISPLPCAMFPQRTANNLCRALCTPGARQTPIPFGPISTS